ncbi:MAG: tRNA (N6-isopentenyl adenosine(37)-C2)-methylthiotransferase MiaB [Christensenellales bacterium]
MIYYKLVTYGCQMNVHESEAISGILEDMGYTETQEDETADIIVFNTCCVRENAERRALGNIAALKKFKKIKPGLIIAVLGCMTEQKSVSDELYKKMPYVDIILGNHNKYELKKAIESINGGGRFYSLVSAPDECENALIRRKSGSNAWINITFGCNNFCSYCIVPYVRGRERSRKKELIIDEVKRCLDEGYKEITLLGQNVNSYGLNLYDNYRFGDLLADIASIDAKFRLSYMTSHPKDFNKEIVDIIKDYPNISRHIHLPVQAGSNRILELMNRRYTKEKYLDIIDYIKSRIPDAGITTDIMVGFPTETDEDFADTLNVVTSVKYLNAFMFVYSPRKGTPAADMAQVPEDIKNSRIRALVDIQRKITANDAKAQIGKVSEVLTEDNSPRFEGMLCGRSYNGRLVHFTPENHRIGDFVKVLIKQNRAAALLGDAVRNK